MSAACHDASMAAAPSVGPTVRCSMTETGSGSAPPSIRIARFWASSCVKSPVIWVVLRMLEPQGTLTPGEEMTSPSRTIAIRLRASVWHAASAESSPKASEPVLLKSTLTTYWTPWSCRPDSAPVISEPSSAEGPISMTSPESLGRTWLASSCGLASGFATVRITGWTVSCAVRPSASTASRGSCTSGSSIRIRSSPERASVGSETPRASTRPRSTSIAWSTFSALASARSVLSACSVIWVPPRRSRPSRGSRSREIQAQPASRPTTSRSRNHAPRDMGRILIHHRG